ncbi:MAG: hypothetical protein P8X96_20760 [Desulfobacteraceae bacterium]|jgi:hypothetical protein
MKSYTKYFLAVTLLFTIGIVAAGSVAAGEQPIWHNFAKESTLSSTSTQPSEANVANTAPIWQTQVDAFQQGIVIDQADHLSSVESLAGTKPIWCEQTKCL